MVRKANKEIHVHVSSDAYRIFEELTSKNSNKKGQIIENMLFNEKVYGHSITRLDHKDINYSLRRTTTGILGLDKALEGGMPSYFLVVVDGETGTGKTIFGLQFLMNTNEKSMLFTFEEDAAQIARHAFQFGYYIADAVKNGRLYLYNIKTICVEEILERIIEIRPKRIVIDSVAALYNEIDRQSGWYHLVTELKKENIACIMITRSCSNGKTSIFENRADGVLCFGKELDNGRWKRHILIKKMRATPLEIVKLPFKIIDKGIVIDESKP